MRGGSEVHSRGDSNTRQDAANRTCAAHFHRVDAVVRIRLAQGEGK